MVVRSSILACLFMVGVLWTCTPSLGWQVESIQRSRERVLRSNLFTLRCLIQQYTLDKKRDPQSLEDLVVAGYLKQVPKDPTTEKADWKPVHSEGIAGIEDVHSASSDIGLDGTRYNTW